MRRWTPLLFVILALVFGFFFESQKQSARAEKETLAKIRIGNSPGERQPSRKPASDEPSREAPVNLQELAGTMPVTDLCDWAKSSRGPTADEAKKLLAALTGKITARDEQTLAWLFQVPGVLPDGLTVNSPELLFLMALEQSGNLFGRSSPSRADVDSAIVLLEKAAMLDQGNGALDLYLASLYQRQGRFELASTSYRRGLKSDRFDVYVNHIVQRLFQAPGTSLEFLKAVDLFAVMPVPDMNPVLETMLSLARSDVYSSDAFAFAQKIVDQAVSSRTPYNHLDWWLSSYAMAGQVLRLREQDIVRSFELNQEYNQFPELPNMSSSKETCRSADVDRDIQRFQMLIRRS